MFGLLKDFFFFFSNEGPKKPKSFAPYLKAIFDEVNQASQSKLFTLNTSIQSQIQQKIQNKAGIEIIDQQIGEKLIIYLNITTCECDGGALPLVSEHMGAATVFNCHKCWNPGVHNEGS